ncbi:hypothetical protein OE749_09945 [Aestuariibacter sp. AA17]|uniref:Uncharacterized protein n=1 Tax=Fluctibacter corallii TaxID=2984329 RepID=A0ABT3A8N0_9ALTE|nr:hypothetical protein [Aestuariibacter sp. AA17]MCV2885018.1 hypothetical protein [Aestuariibacter sp. AA17]
MSLPKYIVRVLLISAAFTSILPSVMANSHCEFTFSDFAPLSVKTLSSTPHHHNDTSFETLQHTYQLTSHLYNTLLSLGLSPSPMLVKVRRNQVQARHNLILTYDLFMLLQLWQQQQGKIRSPARYQFPKDINDTHTLKWIEASVALVYCYSMRQPVPSASAIKMTNEMHFTHSDLYVLLVATIKTIAKDIEPRILRAFFSLRVTQLLYLLQNMVIDNQISSIVNWTPALPPKEALDLITSIRGSTEAHTGSLLPLSLDSDFTTGDSSTATGERHNAHLFHLLLLSDVYADLLYLNIQHYHVELPTIAEIFSLPSHHRAMKEELAWIQRLVTYLPDTQEAN